MTLDRTAPGYRAAPRHQVRNAFDGVGPAMWRCSQCHTPATYSNPLVLLPAPSGSPYSHVFVHREGCIA